MKQQKKVVIIDPYLDVLGGAEKYVLSIAQSLEQFGYEITLSWQNDKIIKEINNRFAINFKSINIVDFFQLFLLEKQKLLNKFDLVIYITDGSYFFSSSKNNYLLAMYPEKKLYQMNLINRLKLINWKFFSFSQFTGTHISQWVGKKCPVLYPYISDDFINLYQKKIVKHPIILSVGRFFPQLHHKNHWFIIDTFKKLKQSDTRFKNYQLVLAGGVKQEDQQFYDSLKKSAVNDKQIIFKSNISYSQLLELYKNAEIYWHAAGVGIDEKKEPEKVEHFGITPLEAMAAGCIVLSPQIGELKNIIIDGKNGFFFQSSDELIKKTIRIINQRDLIKSIAEKSNQLIKQKFSKAVFDREVRETFYISNNE